MKSLLKDKKGFTIIEVLIVLAIAGLILLIVFLAVPALQRNSRNTQRESDVAKIAASVSECLANRNGQPGSCQSLANLQSNGGLETAKLTQIQTINVGAAAPTQPDGFTTANVGFNAKCSDDGSGTGGAGASTRTAAILYRAENGSSNGLTRCIDV